MIAITFATGMRSTARTPSRQPNSRRVKVKRMMARQTMLAALAHSSISSSGLGCHGRSNPTNSKMPSKRKIASSA